MVKLITVKPKPIPARMRKALIACVFASLLCGCKNCSTTVSGTPLSTIFDFKRKSSIDLMIVIRNVITKYKTKMPVIILKYSSLMVKPLPKRSCCACKTNGVKNIIAAVSSLFIFIFLLFIINQTDILLLCCSINKNQDPLFYAGIVYKYPGPGIL